MCESVRCCRLRKAIIHIKQLFVLHAALLKLDRKIQQESSVSSVRPKLQEGKRITQLERVRGPKAGFISTYCPDNVLDTSPWPFQLSLFDSPALSSAGPHLIHTSPDPPLRHTPRAAYPSTPATHLHFCFTLSQLHSRTPSAVLDSHFPNLVRK